MAHHHRRHHHHHHHPRSSDNVLQLTGHCITILKAKSEHHRLPDFDALDRKRREDEAERKRKEAEEAELDEDQIEEKKEQERRDRKAKKDRNKALAISALSKLFAYCIFLMFIFVVVFVNEDNDQQYRVISSIEAQLLGSELEPNVYFDDIMSVGQMFTFFSAVLLPTVTTQTYYNGKSYPLNGQDSEDYQGYWTNEVTMALGKPKLRQVRVSRKSLLTGTDTCMVSDLFSENVLNDPTDEMSEIRPGDENYGQAGNDRGIRACTPGFYHIYEDRDPYFKNVSGNVLNWQWQPFADGDFWSSPKTKTSYPTGGYVENLPEGDFGIDPSRTQKRLDELQAMGFVDDLTRAVFLDMSWYNPPSQLFITGRFVFEMLPTGTVVPNFDIDAAYLTRDYEAITFDGHTFGDNAQVSFVFEIILYICVLLYLTKASDDILLAGGVGAYLRVGWNQLDIANVIVFLTVIGLRIGWMLRGGQITYEVYTSVTKYTALGFKYTEVVDPTKPDWNKYMHIRVSMSLWRYGKTMLAIGVLLNFFKAFKYVEASKHLSAFSKTISAAIPPCLIMFVIMGIITMGYATAYHMTYGALPEYMDLSESVFTLVGFYLGDFSMEELIDQSPYLGPIFFVSYAVITMFVLMTMFLKLIDVAYGDVMDSIEDSSEDDFRELCIAALRHLIEQQKVTRLSRRFLTKGRKLYGRLKSQVKPEEIEKKMMQFTRSGEIQETSKGVEIKQGPTDEELEERYAAELAALSPVDRELERMKRKKRGRTTVEEEKTARRMIVRKYVRANDFSKLEEKDVEEEDLMDRLHLVQHRYSILVKMASRMKNSVEVYTVQPTGTEHGIGKVAESVEMVAMRKLLEHSTAEDMRIDYMETTLPKQHKLPDIPPDMVRLDGKIIEVDEKSAIERKSTTGDADTRGRKQPTAQRELRQDERAAASSEDLTLKNYASLEHFPGQASSKRLDIGN